MELLLDADDLPLHTQLGTRLYTLIANGAWKPGEKIPPERELAEQVGVSRATVRQAVSALVQQGVLEKRRGSGTFVQAPYLETPLGDVYSFYNQARGLGYELSSNLLERTIVPATPRLQHQLGVAATDPLYYLERQRSIRGVVLMVTCEFVPVKLCPNLFEQVLTNSLYRVFADRYHLPVLRAVDLLEAASADADLAVQLGLKTGAAVMYVQRTAFTRNGEALHIGHNYIRGDMCRFRSDLTSKPNILELSPTRV